MQTLTAGSFLNFENAANLEALKFTARRLAEHTASVTTAENFNALRLENLANNLWDKAEYVTREPERRSLREIFLKNFRERFRELKPEVLPAQDSVAEVLSAASTIGNSGLRENAPAPEITEGGKSESATDESAFSVSVAAADADATQVQEKRDEFLGFVKTDEPFVATSIAKTDGATTTAPKNEAVVETSESENESVTAGKATYSESEKVIAEREVSAESANNEKSPPVAATVVAKNNSEAESANKNGANKTETKEPFEFGKCTINLNLVLLPSGDSKSRKAIVSAASHNLPPEIEFLEIDSGEDLTEIARLVRDKLARFKNTLPAKYIERLRASKTNAAKKPALAKVSTPVAAPAKPESNRTTVEETSGTQSAQSSSGTETEKSRAEITATKENVSAQPAPVAAVSQSAAAANNVQPSLF